MKPVIKNRRLLVQVTESGNRKLGVNDVGTCTDCDCTSTTMPCDGVLPTRCLTPGDTVPWVDGGEDPTGRECCFPNSMFFKLDGSSAGDCQTLRTHCVGNPATGIYRVFKYDVKPLGTLDCSGCLQFQGITTTAGLYTGGTGNYDDLVSVRYGGVLPAVVKYDTFFTDTLHDGTSTVIDEPSSGCGEDAWKEAHVRFATVSVLVEFVKPNTPGGKWKVAAAMFDLSGCNHVLPLIHVPGFEVDTYFWGPNKILWATSVDTTGLVVNKHWWSYNTGSEVDKCFPEGKIEFGGGEQNWNYPLTSCSGALYYVTLPHWEGGTVTLKPCCTPVSYDCDGNVITVVKWINGISCSDGSAQDHLWATEGSLKFEGKKSRVFFDELSGTCYYFDKDHSPRLTVPPDEEPPFWKWADVGGMGYKNCDFCSGWIQAFACGTDEALDAWTRVENVYVAPVLPGDPEVDYTELAYTILVDGDHVCVHYKQPAEKPEDATINDPITRFPDCASCGAAIGDADCRDGGCVGGAGEEIVAHSNEGEFPNINLHPSGTGGWGGEDDGFTVSGGLTCVGRNWRLTVTGGSLGGTGGTCVYEKGNFDGTDCDEKGLYTYVSGPCDSVSTVSIS
jgi:hypothetical protein